MKWKPTVEALSPLLRFADRQSSNGEGGVVEKIFDTLPPGPGFAVEFGQRSFDGGTLGSIVSRRGWSALFMDAQASQEVQHRASPQGGRVTLARERITSTNLTELLRKHEVPAEFDALVIDIDGIDYWAWQSLDPAFRPRLVVIEFNAHVDFRVAATIGADDSWAYRRTRDYGASWAALMALAAQKGYRPIHVHGCWNIHFLRNDLDWPPELALKQPLTPDEFALLTATEPAFDELAPQAGRPSWFESPPPDVTRSPWVLLPCDAATQRVQIHDTAFEVFGSGHDPAWYQQRKTFEEHTSFLYPLLAAGGYRQFVDIGANIGFISLLAQRALPNARILAIEADPRLATVARRNFARYGMSSEGVVNAIAGEHDSPATPFALNPGSTLDNRVAHPRWQTVNVPMLRLDRLLERQQFVAGPTFFKIDTQGFELQVLRGLESFLRSRSDWLLKMEFAPDWLRSQGTDPRSVLDHLQLRYEFVEYPERIVYGTPSLDALFAYTLKLEDHERFVTHVMKLNRNGTGWVDLLVRPRAS